MKKNVIVAQSGGPSPVINSSLRGVVETCKAMPDVFGTVYAGFHGIEGVLKEELLDLSAQPAEEIALLRRDPGGRQHRHMPLQAEGQAEGRFRASHRGLPGAQHRLLLLQRRQRLDGHRAQDRGAGPGDGPRADRDRRAQDHRQRRRRLGVQAGGSHARLRLDRALLGAERPGRQRGERRLVPGRPGAGAPGDGPQDRLHPGRGAAGRSQARAAAPDLPGRVEGEHGADGRQRQRRAQALRPLHRGRQRGL